MALYLSPCAIAIESVNSLYGNAVKLIQSNLLNRTFAYQIICTYCSPYRKW